MQSAADFLMGFFNSFNGLQGWSYWALHLGLGVPIGLLASNAGEWFVHKYILHGLGRKKGTAWDFHWHFHHREARQKGMLDLSYNYTEWGWNARTKEGAGLLVPFLLHVPLLWVVPGYAAAVMYSVLYYYYVHRRSHLDPQWAREHLPWHYDHHMGPNQDSNWCVTHPWFDHIMGTREPYVGTAKDAADRARAQKRSTKLTAQTA